MFWMLNATATKDEQDDNPYKPFPKRPYIQPLVESFEYESVQFVEKSRTMMGSWTMAAWAAHKMFTRPATTVVVQSEDYSRAVNIVDYAKTLWANSIPELRARWPLADDRQPFEQAEEKFKLKNGSWMIALPGTADKIRSKHSTIVLFDEAAHMLQGEQCFNLARHTRCRWIKALSSQKPGWFSAVTDSGIPIDWPEYQEEEAVA